MNKAFEKILERLKEELRKSEERYYRYLDDGNLSCMFYKSDIEEKRVDTIKEMLEIVQEIAEEYNGGWIPCSERLPEIRQDCLVTVRYTGLEIVQAVKLSHGNHYQNHLRRVINNDGAGRNQKNNKAL